MILFFKLLSYIVQNLYNDIDIDILKQCWDIPKQYRLFKSFNGFKVSQFLDFSGSSIRVKGRSWCCEVDYILFRKILPNYTEMQHFICANSACSALLTECGYVEVESNGQHYCLRCYECLIAPSCFKCSLPLVDSCLNALGKQWHPVK